MPMPDTDTYISENVGDPEQDDWLSVGEAAALTGYSVSTLQRWDRKGILPAHRTITNQRRYRRSQLLAVIPRAA